MEGREWLEMTTAESNNDIRIPEFAFACVLPSKGTPVIWNNRQKVASEINRIVSTAWSLFVMDYDSSTIQRPEG